MMTLSSCVPREAASRPRSSRLERGRILEDVA